MEQENTPQTMLAPQTTLFDKYKLGLAHHNAPFRLFQLALSFSTCTSGEEDPDSEDKHDRKSRGPYRKYTCQQKMQAVQRIVNGEDVKLISKEYGIPRRNLLRWKKNGCERKQGGGRPTDNQMERLLYAKIKSGQLTDESQIRKYAMTLSSFNSFKASKGWFVKFCHRFNLSQGEQSTLTLLPEGETLLEV